MIKPNDFKRARILIVDDCPDAANLLAELLTLKSYHTIHTTTDAAAVCDLHELNDYDLILLDMHMPCVSGLGIMAQLRKMAPDSYLPVIVLTGNDKLRRAALEAGAYDFITKPSDFTEINVRICNMLEVRLLYKFVNEQRRLQQNIALHDPLTGLPNRRLAMDRIAMAVEHAKRCRNMVALMYLDVDGFKLANDQRGHAYGDELLREIAAQLSCRMRDEDTVARIGGDEFLIVLPEIHDLAGTVRPAQEILHLFSAAMPVQAEALRVTTSIGIAVCPLDTEDPEKLMLRADQALYEAKRAGKNQYRFASPVTMCAAQAASPLEVFWS